MQQLEILKTEVELTQPSVNYNRHATESHQPDVSALFQSTTNDSGALPQLLRVNGKDSMQTQSSAMMGPTGSIQHSVDTAFDSYNKHKKRQLIQSQVLVHPV